MFGSHGMYDPNAPVTPRKEIPLADRIQAILDEEKSFMQEVKREETQQTAPVCPVCGEEMTFDRSFCVWMCELTESNHVWCGPDNDTTGEETKKMIAEIQRDDEWEALGGLYAEAEGRAKKAEARIKELETQLLNATGQPIYCEVGHLASKLEEAEARVRELEIIQASLNNDLLRSTVERNELSDKLDVANTTIASMTPVVEAAERHLHVFEHPYCSTERELIGAVKAHKEGGK